jgi:hypothetical protein
MVTCCIPCRRRRQRPYEVDRVLHGHDLLGGIVGNLAPELLLERHDQLDRVEAVRSEIVDEAGVVGHFRLIDAKMLHHNLFYSLGDIAHRIYLDG